MPVGQGRSNTGVTSLPHVKLALTSAPGPSGGRQKHLDAILAGQRRRMFSVLDILPVKWAAGDLPEERRFLLGTQLMFLKKRKGTYNKVVG